MLVSEIKSKFFTQWDFFQSAYWSDAKLDDFFWQANNEIMTDLMAKYQLINRITDDTMYLTKEEALVTSTNLINLDTDLANSFSSLINVRPTYSVGGITYTNIATPLLAEDKNSYYARGTVNDPKYEFYSNSSSERILKLLPEVDATTTISAATITYFTDPIAILFTVPDYDVTYTDNVIDNIIKKAIQVAASSVHDPELFPTSSVLLNQANQNP